MQQRLKRAGFATAALLLLLLVMTGANTWRQWAGLTVAPDTPAERRAQLEPFWRVRPPALGVPETGGAVVLSGCDGVHDNMVFWAGRLAGRGYRTLILDSHGPAVWTGSRHGGWSARDRPCPVQSVRAIWPSHWPIRRCRRAAGSCWGPRMADGRRWSSCALP